MGEEKAAVENIEISENDQLVSHPIKVANIFNSYFITSVENLCKGRGTSARNAQETTSSVKNNMFLTPTDESEVASIMRNLKNKKSCGHDEIPDFVVKQYYNQLKAPLTNIINCSINTASVPQLLKLAIIKPLYKGNEKKDVNNYRPIALLPVFSKVLELVIAKRLLNFCDRFKIINPEQHGFLKSKNTTSAMIEFTESILMSLEEKNVH